MGDVQKCPDCGCEWPGAALGGLCPQCLLGAGLDPQPQFDADQPTESLHQAAGKGFVAPTPSELADMIPQIEILELLGQGGMGAVYKGRQRSLDRLVAVKILPPDIGRDGSFAERFTREARALGRLSHPNIVAVHDSGVANGLYYFVMEFVDGANLRQLLQDKSLASKDVLAIVQQVCEALQFAHDEGIVHRDIKPENILIDKKGRVKIADFGLAKLIGKNHLDDKLTGTNQVMGTRNYMAPEQIEGAKEIDHRADIYSLGVVFYELLTGELPLGRFAPPSKRMPLDVRLDDIVLRALEKSPEQRFQQAVEVKTEVETVVGTPGEPSSPQTLKPGYPEIKNTRGRITRKLQRLAMDIDEIDNPYLRWVAFPLMGFIGFYIFTAIILLWKKKFLNPLDDFVSFGLVWTAGTFVLLNMIWFVRWMAGLRQTPVTRELTPDEIFVQLRRGAVWLGIVGLLTFVGCFVSIALTEFEGIGVHIGWGAFAGLILCLGSRSLMKLRDPGLLPLLVAMVPFSPAVMLGLPMSLRIQRMLARPEVKAYLESQARPNTER